MYCKSKHKILISIIAITLLIGSSLFGPVSYAQDKYKGEWVLPAHYPDGFDGWGKIDKIESDYSTEYAQPLSKFLSINSGLVPVSEAIVL